jgi:DNA-binding response OmpR family regulator
METKNKKIILVTEDEIAYKKTLDQKLKQEGFEVLDAKNGEEGLIIALKNRPDLILLDLLMPKMGGIAMLREIRKYDDWGKKVPVFILSALSSSNDEINKSVTELEPTYYFEKGDIQIESLVDKIKEELEKK